MIHVYLVRHAIAEQRDFVRWPDDAERPLSPAGRTRFRVAALGLRELVPEIDVVLTSPYVRSVQTAEVLAEVTGWPAAQPAPQLAGNRPAADALALLRSLEGVGSVALIGHEPCLSSLTSLLAAGDEGVLRPEVRKGAVVFLACPGAVAPGAGVLRWSVSPKILRRLAAARERQASEVEDPSTL